MIDCNLNIKGEWEHIDVSVIVPIYNAEKTLKRCVESILCQTHRNIEVILVNDGSSDRSEEICKKYEFQDNRVHYYSENNSGPSKARNLGISKACGIYICFVDSDDYVENILIEKALNSIEIFNADIAIYNAKVLNNQIPEVINGYEELREYFPIMYKNYVINYPWNKLIRRSSIQVLFNTRLNVGEDITFWINNLKANTKIAVLFEDLYHYEIVESSLSRQFNVNVFNTIDYVYRMVYTFYTEQLKGKCPTLINYLLFREFHTNCKKYLYSNSLIRSYDLRAVAPNSLKMALQDISYSSLIEKIAGTLMKYNMFEVYCFSIHIQLKLLAVSNIQMEGRMGD